MLMFSQYESQGVATDVVNLPFIQLETVNTSGVVYSGLRFSSDGNIYKRQSSGGFSFVAPWLVNGVNSDYYIERVIASGTLTTDGGAGPIIMSSNRDYDVQKSDPGDTQAVVSFQFSNDISGVPVIKGPIFYTFKATFETS